MIYDKIQLPYTYDGLEPYIDAKTVEIHYTKYLQGYLDKINSILKNFNGFAKGKTLEQILTNTKKIPRNIREDVINFGGGVVNHNLFFMSLYSRPKKNPEGELLCEINNSFGSVETLKRELTNLSLKQFGSGYGFLVKTKSKKLKIMKMSNQNTPLSYGYVPLLNIDIWEHAYYLKYKNMREDYINNLWNIINWAKVEELYKS